MGKVSCVKLMENVTGMASKRFGSAWVIDEEKYDILSQYCRAFDNIVKEFNAESLKFSVDEDTMEIKIEFVCQELVIDDIKHVYFQLLERSVMTSYKADGDNIIITTIFPSIWYHV